MDLFHNTNNAKQGEYDGFYGLSAEVKKKIASKYDPELEAQARAYLKKKSGQSVNGDFAEALRDGTILCATANAIRPGICKGVKQSKMPFVRMENIGKFISAVASLGVRSNDSFMTIDLYEEKNLSQVVTCILALQNRHP